MDRKIIGMCGFIGSGKGTVGDILIQEYGFQKLSFADALKDGVSAVFGWDRDMLEGVTPDSRKWREEPDEFWTKELHKDITPRYVLQLFGTDCMREGFDKEIWSLIAKRKLIDNPDTNYVIPDVRFYNERDMIHELKGEVWRVRRGQDPDWVQHAINDNRYNTDWMKDYSDIHESEWRWLDHATAYDRTIVNDTDLDDLLAEVKRAIDR